MRPVSAPDWRNFAVFLIVSVACVSLLAQSARERREQLSDRQLQIRAEKAEEALLKELLEVAGEFQKQGLREQCIAILERIETITPAMPGVKERLALLREELLSENGMSVEIDPAKGWGNPVADVEAGVPFRISASGEYKLNLAMTVPLTGLSTADPGKDHINEAPFGSLIGLIVTDGKPGTPFPVGNALEMTPGKSGVLFLRVNVPLIARCTGNLKAQLSGGVRPIARNR